MKSGKSLRAFLVFLLIAGAFIVGFLFHRAGLQREVIYLVNRAVTLAWPASLPVPHYVRFEQCGCVEYPRACPCGIRGQEPIYEASLWRQFLALDPGFTYRVNPGFPALLREAVGFDNILPRHDAGGAEIEQVAKSPYSEHGTLSDLRLRYTHPDLALRALLATHQEKTEELVIVLHGLGSSEEAVMGLRQEDYLRSLGRSLFAMGYDVLAPSVTSNTVAAGAMNVSLQLLGSQIYGLWSRLVCDAARYQRERRSYRRVILYGLSNGGIIVKYATALCDQFDLSIVDDVGISEREGKWNSAQLAESGKWSFLIHHRRPLLAESSVVDWLHFANNSFILVHRRKYIFKLLPPMIGEVFDRVPGLQSTGKIRIVQKRTGIHEPELDVITAILKGQWSTLEGYTLVARR